MHCDYLFKLHFSKCFYLRDINNYLIRGYRMHYSYRVKILIFCIMCSHQRSLNEVIYSRQASNNVHSLHTIQRRHGLKVGDRKLQFSNRQLQISQCKISTKKKSITSNDVRDFHFEFCQFPFCFFEWWTVVCVTYQVHFLGQLSVSNDFKWSHLPHRQMYGTREVRQVLMKNMA